MLIDRDRFPLGIARFEGNIADKSMIVLVVESFRARYDISAMVVAVDAQSGSVTSRRNPCSQSDHCV